MAGGIDEALHDRINRKLQGIVLRDSSSCSIFKVPNQLRKINEKAYEPEVISIGPYHHGKDHLKAMEVHKLHYLRVLLIRGEESGVERYVTALEGLEEKARDFYSEPLNHIGREEFVEMMLLDGNFIIGLISQSISNLNNILTPIILRKVMRDLLLVENQLPFFVLSELCSLSSLQDFTPDAVVTFFYRMMPRRLIKARTENQDLKHLLGLLHDLFYPCLLPELETRGEPVYLQQLIRSATELNDAGINFEAISRDELFDLFDIEFQNGVILIPILTINDDTEFILRNFVAYEQCYEGISLKCFTDYITFMDCLINTGEDVKLLCRCGVLENWLGDHEVVATMFNRLRDSVLISGADFLYSEIFKGVSGHCHRPYNMWKAQLRHSYLNVPGAFISLTSAFVLFLCTILQTLSSFLPSRR